jgi:CRISPR/Cas system-associated endonuclease Cas3-HD
MTLVLTSDFLSKENRKKPRGFVLGSHLSHSLKLWRAVLKSRATEILSYKGRTRKEVIEIIYILVA